MKQKITKTNWAILLFTFLIEFILLIINLISELDISIYNNIFKLIKVVTICLSLDIIFILYILDFASNKKKPKNILKTYKADVNLRIPIAFFIAEIIKIILIFLSIGQSIMYYSRYKSIIGVYVGTIIMYYIVFSIMPKKENLFKKLQILKSDIKKGETELNFILIDGNTISSSFDIEKTHDYKISKNNIYINLKKDFNKINNKKVKKLILDNTIAIIHEVDEIDNDIIIKIYEKQEINNSHMYHIMAVKNYKEINLNKNIEYINAIKICDMNSAIEFTENLFEVNANQYIGKLQYNRALKKIQNLQMQATKSKDNCNNILDDDKLGEKYIKNLNIIYQYNFNNRLKYRQEVIPKEKSLFEIYRNAYINDSAYQSILIMFNYITVMGKLVEYYLYAKNNPKFNENKINKSIIGDNPPIWNNHILLNIYKNEEDILYNNLRKEKFKLTNEEEILLNVYLSKILNAEIKGKEITFDGLMYLFIQFRNKVEAHGIISDANVYAVWKLTVFFSNMLNKMFKISELECEYGQDEKSIKVGYNGEEKINTGKYVITKDKIIYLIKDTESHKDLYMNYFTGDTIPVITEKEK